MIKYLRYCTRLGKSQSLYSFNSEGKCFFSFAKSHPFKTKTGELNEDGLVLTHLTDYFPANGCIDTAHSAMNGARDSVHFAVNHGVTSHEWGVWGGKEFAIVMPFRRTLEESENKFVGGLPSDFFSKGKVKIPNGSIIVKRNPNLKSKFRIFEGSADLPKGTKIIETSIKDMKSAVDEVIKRLGYRKKNNMCDPSFWGDVRESVRVDKNGNLYPFNVIPKSGTKDMKLFRSLLAKKGMTMTVHALTPNAMLEFMVEEIFLHSLFKKNWVLEYNGKAIHNTKAELLKHIDFLEELSKTTKLEIDINTKTLKEIIQTSKNPTEAAELIKQKLNIKPMLKMEILMQNLKYVPEKDLLSMLLAAEFEQVGTHQCTKDINSNLTNFFAGNIGKNDIYELGSFNADKMENLNKNILDILS